jgi:hypothetical protein
MMYISVTPLPGTATYELNRSVVIDGFFIKAGFKWDGASIPRILWRLIDSPFQPDLMVPSMVHDYLYTHGANLGVSRKEADLIFKKLLISNGFTKFKANILYKGVRVGGYSSYKRG